MDAPAAGSGTVIRLEDGAVIEDLDFDDVGPVIVRYSRRAAGWTAAFAVCAAEDVEVVHSLEAPTFAQARRAVPAAVRFLLGRDADER